jgi:hypothetical protein
VLHDPDRCLTRSDQDPEARDGEDKRETLLVRACLPFPICETRFVRVHLLSTYERRAPNRCVSFHLASSNTVWKFSITSSTGTHTHQFLNPRQSKGFKDIRRLVLHTVLLAPHPRCARWDKYVAYLLQQALLRDSARSISSRILCIHSFCAC